MADITEIGVGGSGLELFFNPGSVAVIGASEKSNSSGRIILENLLVTSNKRQIYAVNPNHSKILELKSYPKVTELPVIPDLAVIISPADTVPGIVEECGKKGVRAVVIISSGFREIGDEGIKREEKIIKTAREYHIKIVGPNCMGIIRPSANLNTTFIQKSPKSGCVAFLSQSGALGAGILDWAIRKNLGFSAFVSLGSMIDVDFGQAIDYFGEDPETKSIIIYPESLGNVKSFISAARGFARSKPIIVLHPGKFRESALAARSHTGAILSEDAYFDAIFNRVGIVRVEEMRDLFNCASMLDMTRLPQGPNVAIITNGGGPAVLAIDNLIGRGGKLAELSETTLITLDKLLPSNWSKANPIDIREDADTKRYADAIEAAIRDSEVNGVIIIYTPQGRAKAADLAPVVIEQAKKTSKPIITAFIGSEMAAEARQLLYEAKVPAFEFPEDAIKTYLYMWQYAHNLDMLYQTPEESPTAAASKNHIRTIIRRTIREGRKQLSPEDAFRFLSTYRIPTTSCYLAKTAEEAVELASSINFPVVMKIASEDVVHKSDVDGVVRKVSSNIEVRTTFHNIISNLKKHIPNARIDGVTIHNMVTDYDYELIVGAKRDRACGPVIMFGLGGKDTEYFRDFAVGLPPLNQALANRILEQTRIYDLLMNGSRNRPPVNIRQLSDIMIKVSNLVSDFPEISELEINPLAVSKDTVIALDARFILDTDTAEKEIPKYGHLVISPYPTHYIIPWQTQDGRSVLLRPIKPEDEVLERKMLERLSDESIRLRFFSVTRKVSHDMLTRFCNIDYDREMTIIAEYNDSGEKQSIGNSHLMIQTDGKTGEFAVLVAEDFRNVGLGLKLTDMIIGIAREKGLKSIYCVVLKENVEMINLARRLGFIIQKYSEDEVQFFLEL